MAGTMDQRLRDGIAAAQAKRIDEARVLLQDAVNATPDSALAWFWLAVVAPTADSAISHLRRALMLDPSHQGLRQALAKLLLTQASRIAKDDVAGARALADESTGLAPELEAAWLAMASLAEERSIRLAALRRAYAIHQAAATRERLQQALLHEAVTAASRDRALARRRFSEAATLAPDDLRIWRALVQLADSASEALAAVRDLVALAPDLADGRLYLHKALVADARAHAAFGDRATARDRWHEVTSLDAQDLVAWLGLAECTSEETEVRQALESAFSINPHDARVLAAMDRARSVHVEETRVAADETADPWMSFALEADPFARFAPAPHPDAPTEVPHPAAPDTTIEAPVAVAPASERPRVMVIDDSPTIRKILSLTLEGAGYSVLAEPDGESGLKRLASDVPDVVLLDIAMPGIDGYETCKRIKGDSRTAHLPILMLSGKDALFDKVKGHMAGASEYLTKPFEAGTVLAAVAGACPASAR